MAIANQGVVNASLVVITVEVDCFITLLACIFLANLDIRKVWTLWCCVVVATCVKSYILIVRTLFIRLIPNSKRNLVVNSKAIPAIGDTSADVSNGCLFYCMTAYFPFI